MKIEFCLPAYNEEKILEKNILKLFAYCEKQNFSFDWKIVIVINGSNDNSEKIVKKITAKYPEKISYINFKRSGRGRALKKYWLQSKADIVTYMDIDLAVSLDNIHNLIKPLLKNKADVTIGSRLLPESSIDRSFIRELSSQSYNFLSRVILNHNFSDLQCGFKAVKKEAFKKIAPHVNGDKWFFDTELVTFANYFKFRIKEIPVNWSENRYDERKSKVNLLQDSIKFFINLIKLKIRIITKK